MEDTASNAHCDNGGLRPSHDLEDEGFGAIIGDFEPRLLI